jgi:hypothetical protein
MSLKIEEIIIYLDTGIPNSKKDEKEPLKLTSQLIYNPDLKPSVALNDNPFITPDYNYENLDMNTIIRDGYTNIVSFFFNKELFNKKIKKISKNVKKEIDMAGNSTDKYIIKTKNIQSNIQTMLKLLFPTSYPVKNNIVSTYNSLIDTSNQSSLKNIFTKMTNIMKSTQNKYSYLKIDSKIYTVSKIFILDDMVNNPFYRDIIESYNKFSSSSAEQKEKITFDLINNFKVLMRNIHDEYKPNKKNKKNFNIQHFINEPKGFSETITLNKKKLENYKNSHSSSTTISNLELLIQNLEIIKKNLDDLNSFQDNLLNNKEINNINKENINDNIDKIYSYIKNIYESYEKIKSISNVTTELDNNIERDFKDKIKILNNEVTQLNYLKKVSNQYLDEKTTNLNFSNEDDKEFVDFVNKKYPTINKFVEELKNNVVEKRKSSNKELQRIIENFYEKKELYDEKVSIISFSDLMKNVNTELIEINSKLNFFKEKNNKELINIGINLINVNNNTLPQYEVYVATNLMEGEYNDTNINSIKCNQKSEFMGQFAENVNEYVDTYYSIQFQRLFIEKPKEKVENPEEKDKKKEVNKKPQENKIKKGGKKNKTKKYLHYNKINKTKRIYKNN